MSYHKKKGDYLVKLSQECLEKYYLKVYSWCQKQLQHSRKKPLLVGVSGPQGSGKSTLVDYLAETFNEDGYKAIALSLDDFYLTFKQQQNLAAKYSDNIFLQYRGNPGTHDIDLGNSVLRQLLDINQLNEQILIPRYDKTLNQGRGDRLPKQRWQKISPPVDIIFFEGWMMGFKPLSSESITDSPLRVINNNLAEYLQWYNLFGCFIVLSISDIDWVYHWRTEAEENSKKQGFPGLTKEELTDYINRFIPLYELYLPQLYQEPLLPGNQLTISLDFNRLPTKNIII